VSLVTRKRDEKELAGLVYSLTERPKEGHLSWYQRPATLGVIVLLMTVVLNIIFW
jgi:SSS family solute:Na+ symporter